MYCWGDDHRGQLGTGAGARVPTRADPAEIGLAGVVELAAGADHTCARQSDGSLWCWGNNSDGEVGDGTLMPRPTPVRAALTGVTAIAAGVGFTCATNASATYCFGNNDHGQLARAGAGSPAPVAVSQAPYAAISAGDGFACGIDSAGKLSCWGENSHGQIGNGGVGAISPPDGPAGAFSQVAAGGQHVCAVDTKGVVWCWGAGVLGQLGNFVLADSHAPVNPTVSSAIHLGAGRTHSCATSALNGYGWVECFGDNADGEAGVGGWNRIEVPMVTVPGLGAASILDGGATFHCALTAGAVSCWGDNARGQLGIGTYSRSMTPIAISRTKI